MPGSVIAQSSVAVRNSTRSAAAAVHPEGRLEKTDDALASSRHDVGGVHLGCDRHLLGLEGRGCLSHCVCAATAVCYGAAVVAVVEPSLSDSFGPVVVMRRSTIPCAVPPLVCAHVAGCRCTSGSLTKGPRNADLFGYGEGNEKRVCLGTYLQPVLSLL